MASIVLKVSPYELKKQSGEILEEIREIESDFDEIDRLVTETVKYWEGEASTQHIKSYNNMKEHIKTVIKRLKEHPVDLEKMAGVYQGTEEAIIHLASALPTDILS